MLRLFRNTGVSPVIFIRSMGILPMSITGVSPVIFCICARRSTCRTAFRLV
jgi:hypothetical protein